MIKKISDKIWDFIIRRKTIIFMLIITIIALGVRIIYFDKLSGDMYSCLEPWSAELKSYGGLPGLKYEIGNYNVPYMTILALLTYLPFKSIYSIKTFSIIFDFMIAILSFILVKKFLKENPKKNIYASLAYGVILMLPTVIWNSAAWGQCDSIYAAFAIMAVILLMDKKYFLSFVTLGVSFAFKLQFIFVLPVFILIYLKKREFPLYYFLIIPIVNLIMCVPALVAGKPFMDIIDIYVGQIGQYSSYISMNQVSWVNLFLLPDSGSNITMAPDQMLGTMGILLTISIFGIAAFISLGNKKEYDNKAVLELALWSVMICNFVLPNMHERYGYIADILSVLYFFIDKKKGYLAIGCNFASMLVYSSYLFGHKPITLTYLSVAYLVMLVIFSKEIFEKYFYIEEKEELEVVK